MGILISCFGIMNTDLRFLQDDPEIKKQVEVQLGPFACFALRKVATAIQKYIVPWSIAMFGLSFQKMQTIETCSFCRSTQPRTAPFPKQFLAIKSSDDKPTYYVTPKTISYTHGLITDSITCLPSDACNQHALQMRS